MSKKEMKIKKLTKKEQESLRTYRRTTLLCISFIIMLSLWLKIAFNNTWHFNDVIVEFISLFIIITLGVVANIKNDLPLFETRKFKINKDFLYSFILSLSLVFFFMMYKNITNPDFINYLARLSFHDLTSIIVFLLPVFISIIFLVYLGVRIFDKDNDKKSEQIYQEKIEKSLDKYKIITLITIFIIMCTSLWIKVGFMSNINIPNVIMEISILLVVLTLTILGNISNKLNAFYNKYFYLDRYFVYSLILPYLLILIYMIFNKDFRFLMTMIGARGIISLLVSLSPLFTIASCIFYKGIKIPTVRRNNKISNKTITISKVKQNSLISLVCSLAIIAVLFYYSFNIIITNYNLENILQVIILFIPLLVIFYLIIYSSIKEINK